jgi:SAM-dependent methyltransferase
MTDPGTAPLGALDDLARRTGWTPESVCEWTDGLWLGNSSRTAYSEDQHGVIDEATDSSWWYATRAEMIVDLLDECGRPRALWDIGAGSGTVSRALQSHGIPMVAVEPGRGGAQAAAASGLTVICAALESLDLPDASIPAAGLFDVLEHVDDRPALLRELHRVIEPGGMLVLTVPAYRWLWSDADVVAGHTTRYTRDRLLAELRGAGFRPQRVGYRFASLVAPIAALRALPYRLGRRPDLERTGREVSRGAGPLGEAATWAERRVGRHLGFGTSVFGVFRRP